MASTNSTVDGMGFEEIGQVGSQPTNIWIAGSIYANQIYSAGSLVGLVNVYSPVGNITTINSNAGSITSLRAMSVYSTQGQLYSTQIGSPVTYGAVVKAGNVTTSAGSLGFITFGNSFSTATYYVSVCPGSADFGATVAGSGWYTSGIRHKSGCWLVGAPSLGYDYIAVGTY